MKRTMALITPAWLTLVVALGSPPQKAKADIVDIWTQPSSAHVVQGQSSYFDVMALSQVPIRSTSYDLGAMNIEQIIPGTSEIPSPSFWESDPMSQYVWLNFPGGNTLLTDNRLVGHYGPGALSRHHFTVPQTAIPGTVVTPYFNGYVHFRDINKNDYYVNSGVTITGQGSFTVARALKGDLNCDGSVNFKDINPFVTALTNPSASQQYDCYPNGDINNDGSVNFQDINPFVGCLTSGCP